jgi:hypothetical protein
MNESGATAELVAYLEVKMNGPLVIGGRTVCGK